MWVLNAKQHSQLALQLVEASNNGGKLFLGLEAVNMSLTSYK